MGWSASSRPPSQARRRAGAARSAAAALVLCAAAALQACIYVPRTTQVYDEDCRIAARQMVLELEQVAFIGGCANEGCLSLLVAAGVVTAASAVVSGSIVIAGNIAYWFEKQGQCARLR